MLIQEAALYSRHPLVISRVRADAFRPPKECKDLVEFDIYIDLRTPDVQFFRFKLFEG